MWVSVQTWFQGSFFEIQNIANLAILSFLFICLLILLSLGFIFFQNKLGSIYLGGIVGITYSLIFGISNLNLVGLFVFIMLLYHAQDLVNGEINARIKINSYVLIRKGLNNFFVAFFILISFAAYQSPAVESFKGLQELPSGTGSFVKTIIGQTLGSQLEAVDPKNRELVLDQVSQEVIREANLFLRPYFDYIPPALAFGLFLVLWGLGWIFIWLAIFLGTLIFWILKKIKFFRIEERDVKAETIVV